MLPADLLRERLAALGISDRSRIVVYYGKDWVSPTTRVIFTLDYAGLGPVTSLLDGGMAAWVREGRQVTTEVPAAKTGTLSALELQPIVVDAEYVRGNLEAPNVAIVDSRTPPFYEGTQAGGSSERPHRAGHIPGARSVPFSTLTNEDLTIRSADEIRAAFAKAGVNPGDTVITYCHIGQQATATAFAARLLGHKVLLYDGSFEDWSRRADYPVETGIKPQRD
jgi:thiosulfate/3-mercaptopyruvate sulfurtransferase